MANKTKDKYSRAQSAQSGPTPNSSLQRQAPNWFEKHEIVVKDANRTYKTDVVSTMQRFRYYKMAEIIDIIGEKIKKSDVNNNYEESVAAILKHMELKETQKKLAKEIQTVIHPG